MEPYTIRYRILAGDTDAYRRLRLSRLFAFLQEAAIAHTEALGAGRERTLDRGYLWVVTVQQAKIARLPEYDETVTLESLPGEIMHTLFPRYYRLLSENGEELCSAAALWALMDQKTRGMAFPEKAEVFVPGAEAPWQTFMPAPPRLPENGAESTFTVPYSYVDLNGHMNNTRYLDLAEDLMDPALRRRQVKEVRTEFTGEATCGETLRLFLSQQNREARLSGFSGKRLFRLSVRYAEQEAPCEPQ